MGGSSEVTRRAPRALLSCVGENRPDWFTKMENLVLSLRLLGEGASQLPIVVNLVGGADPGFVARVERWGAEVRVVDRVDPRMPNANKLRMFELADRDDFDVLLALDCDMVVLGDLRLEVSATHIRATPSRFRPFPERVWMRLCEAAGVPVAPELAGPADHGRARRYPYYNGGILFVPREHCLPLREEWNRARERLLELEKAEPGVLRGKHDRDQPSLACTLGSGRFPVDPLPDRMNLPLRRFEALEAVDVHPPLVVHYHRDMDPAGFPMQPAHSQVAAHVDRFNRARSQALGIPYSSMTERPQKRFIAVRQVSTRLRLLGRMGSRLSASRRPRVAGRR